ncbi:MAG: DinB family protein [Candidatus Dormiibacterota bacterium]
MKQESAAFTSADVPRFFNQLAELDMGQTAERLEAASRRMEELAARIPDQRGDGEAWNAKEVLAHVAVLSRAYGVFAYMVAHGRIGDLNLGDVISQRDKVGEEMAQLPVPEILAEAKKQHDRTLKFLRSATIEQWQTTCKTEFGDLRVEGLIRLPLVVHLEDHLDQIERILTGDSATVAASG